MKRILSKYLDKLFFKKWIFGICNCDIKDVIRSKNFDPDIKWLFKKSFDRFYADPFLLRSKDDSISILLEDFTFDDKYGKIAVMKFDKNFMQLNHKVLLDTKSHLSYPFIFTENDKIYVFPESSKAGILACYEYDHINETFTFLQNILDLPLLDATILRHEKKYWIFGTVGNTDKDYQLHVFYSQNLLGPYTPHFQNPVATGLDGIRSAGSFIEVDGIIYRPTQNCKNLYGESITINKLTELNKENVAEEPYMTIYINKKNRLNHGVQTIHTINAIGNMIVVDGKYWSFSPFSQLKRYSRKIFKL